MAKNKENKRLAIVVSHPIQYYSPLFRTLSKEIDIKVFYCFAPSADQQGRDGFGIAFNWDVDLLGGYESEFLDNISANPSSSVRSGCDTPSVGKQLDSFSPTHVVTFGWHLKSYQQVFRYCKRNHIPIAVRGDSKIDTTDSIFKKLLKRIYYPFFLNKYDAFLSVGEENKKYLMNFGVPSHKIIFSPHSVDQNFWSGVKKEHPNYTFIWVAKFVSLKRPFDVIDAFQMLASEYPNVELKMVGTGPLLKQSIERAKNNDRIKFLGFKNQMELREEYLGSDVLILSSDSETWGLVVNEALSVGLKVIVSSKVGCAPDLIKAGFGRIYAVGSSKELCESMVKFYNSKYEYKNEINQLNRLYSFERNIKSFKEFLLVN